MAEKILKTRIQLRYDTLENWARNNPVLKAGEIAIATIPTAAPANKQLPPVMFKVGDGTSKFNELDWASALAADVYDWAKAATKPSYSYDEISGKPTIPTVGDGKITINQGGVKKGEFTVNQSTDTTINLTDIDTDTQYQLALSGHTLKLQSKAKGATAWTDEQTLTLPDNNTTYAFAEGTTNGAFSVTPSGSTTATSVKVHGLKSAAYTESSAYATAAQGTKAENALPKTEFDTFKTSNTKAIADAKAAGTTAQESLNSYKTTNDAAVGKNATDIANLQTAVKAGITFKGKVDALPAVTDYENGDLIIVGTKEYILSDNAGTKTWIELGDEGSHLTKATADGYYVAKNASITGATKCKITYDSKGLVTKGEDLKAADIPDLSASKITSGTFADNRIASASTWNAKQNALSVDQLNAVNSGITADKVEAYDGYATTIAGKQDKLSDAQLKAVNSGITSALVTKYNGYETSKQDKITTGNKLAASLVSGLATVATSGSYNDLTNKPSIPSAANNAALKDTSGQTIFTANASEDVTITVIDCGDSTANW